MSSIKQGSGAELAFLLGIDPRTVRKLVEKRVLHPISKDVFDLATSIQAYVAYREDVIAAEHGLGDFIAGAEVIDLVYYHGKSVREVADIVGVAEATVKRRVC